MAVHPHDLGQPSTPDDPAGYISRQNLDIHRDSLVSILNAAEKRGEELRSELEANDATEESCRVALQSIEEHQKVQSIEKAHPATATSTTR